MMCSKCGKNVAVVFVTKVENGVQKNEGLCMTCAKKLGINSINNIIDKMGMTEEEFDEMNTTMMESMGDIESLGDLTPDMLMPMMQNAFGSMSEEHIELALFRVHVDDYVFVAVAVLASGHDRLLDLVDHELDRDALFGFQQLQSLKELLAVVIFHFLYCLSCHFPIYLPLLVLPLF